MKPGGCRPTEAPAAVAIAGRSARLTGWELIATLRAMTVAAAPPETATNAELIRWAGDIGVYEPRHPSPLPEFAGAVQPEGRR
jgi:hypothetical protein